MCAQIWTAGTVRVKDSNTDALYDIPMDTGAVTGGGGAGGGGNTGFLDIRPGVASESNTDGVTLTENPLYGACGGGGGGQACNPS